jgi:hypothetical protein
MDDLRKILDRAIKDEHFVKTLKTHPEDALKEAGVASTPEKIAALHAAIDSLKKAHAAFGGKLLTD